VLETNNESSLIERKNAVVDTFPCQASRWISAVTCSQVSVILKKKTSIHTLSEMGYKAMSCLINKITLSCNTNGGENVVPSAHNFPNASLGKLIKHTGCGRLQFVLEYDKPNNPDSASSRFIF